MSATAAVPDADSGSAPAGRARRVLLVWDAPNSIWARRHSRRSPHRRPTDPFRRTWALVLGRTAEPFRPATPGRWSPRRRLHQHRPGSADVVRPWVEALRNVGFAVFAKPKIDEDSDIDADMLAHIALRAGEGLAGLVVASADGQAFREPLEEIAARGVPVQVIGFREHASWAVSSEILEFVDLEDIPGVFREPLPRVSLDSLPDAGAWLQPFRPLSALLSSRADSGVT